MAAEDRRPRGDPNREAELAKAFVRTVLMLEAAGHGPSPSRLPEQEARRLSDAEQELRRALESVVKRLVAAPRSRDPWVPCHLGRHESAGHEASLKAIADALSLSTAPDWGSFVDAAADWLSPSTFLAAEWKQKLRRALQKAPLEAPDSLLPGGKGMAVSSGDIQPRRDDLIEDYAPLVRHIAERLSASAASIEVQDLITVGIVDLIDAIDKFSPDHGAEFKTYAEFRIRGAMLDYLRRQDWAPRSKGMTQVFPTLEQQLKRPAAHEEVSDAMGIPEPGVSISDDSEKGQEAVPALRSAASVFQDGEGKGAEKRRALAKMVMKLFEHWGLSNADQAILLGLSRDSRSSLNRYRRGNPLADSRDLLDRVGHLLAIHRALRTIFPKNRELAYHWPTSPNRDFQGKAPLEVIREDGFAGLLHVRDYLEEALTH